MEIRSPDFRDQSDYETIEFEQAVGVDELIEKGPEAYLERVPKIAAQIIDAQHKTIFGKINEVTSRTGMVTDARGKPFSPEMLLESLKKMEISFDQTGEARMPTLVMAPKLADSVKDKLPEWDKDPELKRRLNAIIQKKRQEWIDRENSRKLVD